MLRDPMRQTISHLAWVKRLGDSKHIKNFDSSPKYIKRSVERIDRLDIVELIATLTQEEKSLFDNCQTRYLLPFHGNVELIKAHLLDALYKLHKFDLIGITEKYEESLLLLSFLMGWTLPQAQKKLNQSDRQYLIDIESANEEVKKSLERITHFDKELYRHARAAFERQFRQMLYLFSRCQDPRDY